jgi:putative membrane protein
MNWSDWNSYFVWIKAFHIIFVICWFACSFYLPRLFINYILSENAATQAQLVAMMRKLYRFSIPFVVITLVTGFALFSFNSSYYLGSLWFLIKVFLVGVFFVYHLVCGLFVSQFAKGKNSRGHVFYRLFNELPVVFILFPVVILVVVKPF